MPVGLTLWSVGLGIMWNRSSVVFLSLVLPGSFVGARFYYLRTPEADKRSYLLYNVSPLPSIGHGGAHMFTVLASSGTNYPHVRMIPIPAVYLPRRPLRVCL